MGADNQKMKDALADLGAMATWAEQTAAAAEACAKTWAGDPDGEHWARDARMARDIGKALRELIDMHARGYRMYPLWLVGDG